MGALELVSSLFLMAFAVFIGVVSFQLGIGGLELMGAGFMPFLASILLFVLSLVALLSGLAKARTGGGKRRVNWSELVKPTMLVAALIVYALFFKTVGYPVMTFLLVYFLFFMMQPQKWKTDVFWAALVAGLSFLLFDVWLRVALPWGILR